MAEDGNNRHVYHQKGESHGKHRTKLPAAGPGAPLGGRRLLRGSGSAVSVRSRSGGGILDLRRRGDDQPDRRADRRIRITAAGSQRPGGTGGPG